METVGLGDREMKMQTFVKTEHISFRWNKTTCEKITELSMRTVF